MAKLTVQLPAQIADEIADASKRSERSVGFLVLGALKSAGTLSGEVPSDRRALELTTDEDDPRDLGARLKKLAGEKAKGKSLDEAIALAWESGRAKILAWVARIAAIDEESNTDDLDEGLRLAADPATPAATLTKLASSPYVRVRALVAVHESTPAAAIEALRADKDRVVREALATRAS